MPPPPQPPWPPRMVRPNHPLHLVATLLTAGLWGLVWVMVWWSADARNNAEQDRYHRNWAAYQEALQEWRWRHVTGPYGPPPF